MTKLNTEFKGDCIFINPEAYIKLERVWSMLDDGFYNTWNVYIGDDFVISYDINDYSLQDVVDRALELI